MPRNGTLVTWLIASQLVAAAPSAAAGVLDQVPRDALAVVVVHNLSQVDARAAKLFEALGVPLPGPLKLLESFAGVAAGLDTGRDLLVVLLPSENEGQPFHLALWLPAGDFDGLVRSLEGDPQRPIAAVTIAGEDLLVARRGDWAVVMDPDQRERLERIDAGSEPPRQLTDWTAWAANNDVALVALPAGIRAAWAWLDKQPRVEDQTTAPTVPADDDLFGPPRGQNPADDFWPALLATFRSLMADAPQLERWIAEAQGVGCALALNDAGDAVVRLRIELPDEALPVHATAVALRPLPAPPQLFDSGEFIIAGSGWVARRWSVLAVAPHLRNLTQELATDWGVAPDEDAVAEFRRAAENAVADIDGFAILTRPGQGKEGVFTNSFLAVRVASDAKFVEHAGETMQRWNGMFDQEGAVLKLVFASQPVTVAGRPGTEYSIDMASAEMAAALGAPAIPEFRQSLEKLFGPEGKIRVQLVAVDERTVLLALATEEQAAEAIKLLGETRSTADTAEVIGAADGPLRTANDLLAARADWRLYFSPHGYVRWQQRKLDAVLGPVIGGPIIRDLPASPPIAAAGGLAEQTAWVEFAVSSETLQTLSRYLRQ
jgi:hypothetical protein